MPQQTQSGFAKVMAEQQKKKNGIGLMIGAGLIGSVVFAGKKGKK
jgi:hypothetical protein